MIFGGDGADQAWGGRGRDALWGDNPTLSHDTSDDYLNGGRGHDLVEGQDGNDRLIGGPDDDDLEDTAGGATISGGQGNDFIDLADHGQAWGGAGNDRFSLAGQVTARGGAGADQMIADAGSFSPRLYGDPGSDSILVDTRIARGTIVSGGSGHDILALGVMLKNVRTTYRQVVIDLAGGTLRAGDRRASVPGFEDLDLNQLQSSPNVPPVTRRYRVTGTSGPNRLDARGVIDPIPVSLHGMAGNDRLLGGFGNDLLDGGRGHDRGSGEVGHDTCISIEALAGRGTQPCEVVRH